MKAVCEDAILFDYSFFVLNNVVVPHLNRVGVVHALVADGLNLKTTALKLVNVPVEWARGISTREDVLAHEVAPNKVFVLPFEAESGNLQEEESI